LPLSNAQSGGLGFALHGLHDTARDVLHKISAFRMPATYDTLTALMVGDRKPFADENALVASLTEHGVAVLAVFHDADAMRRLADRVVELGSGLVRRHGAPAELLGTAA